MVVAVATVLECAVICFSLQNCHILYSDMPASAVICFGVVGSQDLTGVYSTLLLGSVGICWTRGNLLASAGSCCNLLGSASISRNLLASVVGMEMLS